MSAPAGLDAGTVMSAAEALKTWRGGQWTDEQVAYLVALAYREGLTDGQAYNTAELLAGWAERWRAPGVGQLLPTREDRIAAEIAQPGPARYLGGPVDWETGQPIQEAAA